MTPSQDSLSTEYPARPALAVGAVVFKDNQVLLVKRGNPPAKGDWAIPGGSVKIGETLQEAAQREILEETGIVIKAGEPVWSFESIHRDDQGRVRFHYYIVDLKASYVSGEPVPADDAMEAKWVCKGEIRHLNVNPATRRLLKETYSFY